MNQTTKKCPGHILIVEDDADHALLIKSSLSPWTKQNKIKMEIVTSLESALEKLSSSSLELILTDYRLPGKSGLELMAEIKNRKLNLPV